MTHVEIKRRIVGTRRDDLVTLPAGDLHDVIALCEATAEREAKMREVIETAIEDLIVVDTFAIDSLHAASKGEQ